jgi:hypothetical protein
MCETAENVKGTIRIIEEYCLKFDIILNGKKTVWMRIGEKPLIHPISKERLCRPCTGEEKFTAAGVNLEKVYKFKFLGMTVTSDNNDSFHLEHRKAIAKMGSNDLDKIGLKNSLLEPEVKGLLLQTLIRSKLSYGLENIELTESMKKSLITFEANIIKKYFNLPRRAYTTPLLQIAKVRPLDEALEARRLNMIMQLISNPLTSDILVSGELNNYSKTLAEIGFNHNDQTTTLVNRNQLASICLNRINKINQERQHAAKSLLAQAVEKLMKNDTRDNNRLIRYMLHAENGFRDEVGIG